MKKLLLLLFSLTLILPIYSQDNSFPICGTNELPWVTQEELNKPFYLRQGFGSFDTIEIAVVFVDFPDGRFNGEQVFFDQQISSVTQKDAIAELGVERNLIDTHLVAAKYTYLDRWNMIFSTGVYNGNIHPDYNAFEDIAYGSMKEYFLEATNGHYIVKPSVTFPSKTGDVRFKTGIINRDTLINGRRLIKYITLQRNKYGENSYLVSDSYQDLSNLMGGFTSLRTDTRLAINTLKQNGELEFDLNNFTGKLIIIFAGGSNCLGGLALEPEVVCKGTKLNFKNDISHQNNKKNRMDGFNILVHELSHISPLNFTHSNSGRYCIMNPTSTASHPDCPAHFNPQYKIIKGWIEPIAFDKNQTISNLQPIETSNTCGIVTIYGKPSASPDWNTGEYYIIENRRLLGFDQKINKHDNFNGHPNFYGGLLIWHYSPYNIIPLNNPNPSSVCIRDLKLILPDNDVTSIDYNTASPQHFYGYISEDPMYYNLDSHRTKSSYSLKTGLRLLNISQNNTTTSPVSLNINYSIHEPPDYKYVIYSNGIENQTINLEDTVYYHSQNTENKYLLSPGTVIETGIVQPKFKVIKILGNQNNIVTMNGAGYNNYRINWYMEILGNMNPIIYDSIIFNNCIFKNFKSNGSLNLYSGQYNNIFSFNNLNTTDTSIYINLTGNNTEIYNSYLSKYSNSNIKKFNFHYKWIFDLNDNFIIPETGSFVVPESGEPNINNELEITNSKELICNGFLHIGSNFKTNSNIRITPSGTALFSANEKEGHKTNVRFPTDKGIYCEGSLKSISYSPTELIEFNKSENNKWAGIICNSPTDLEVKGSIIKNAITGLSVTSPLGPVILSNSLFESNELSDVKLDNYSSIFDYERIIQNCKFFGEPTHLASVISNEGSNLIITSNFFNDIETIGISTLYSINPSISSNIITANTNSYSVLPVGIYLFSSDGNINCNVIKYFSDGILFDMSSPYVFKNEIKFNGYGMYLTNASFPVLSPSYTQSQTLINAGYNSIIDNLYSGIFCNNSPEVQPTLPIINKGYNIILGDADCLITTNLEPGYTLEAIENYWGEDVNDNRFCPLYSVNYFPDLDTVPQIPETCEPFSFPSNNENLNPEILLYGNAALYAFNGLYENSSNIYKQIINSQSVHFYNYYPIQKIFFNTIKDEGNYFNLETYYLSIRNMFPNYPKYKKKANIFNSYSDVKQPSYFEAITEYDSVLNNSTNEVERHYANIDKMRTYRLMLDSLLNGYGDNIIKEEKIINNLYMILNENIGNTKKSGENKEKGEVVDMNKSVISKNIIHNIKGKLNISDNFSRNKDVSSYKAVFEKLYYYKILEYIITNHTADSRPLNRKENYLQKSKPDISPLNFELKQNYPNPFNSETKILYQLPENSIVTLVIYDILGREVKKIINSENKIAGSYIINLNTDALSSGVYFYKLTASGKKIYSEIKKMVVIK